MAEASPDPQPRLVNARDDDLPVGEFQEAARVAIEHRRDHALRRELDGKSGLAQSPGERKIVADGTVPEFKHVALLEAFPANGRAASPAEISVVLAEVRRGGRIPGRRQRAPESAGLREKPAKRGHRAEIRDPRAAPQGARASSGRGARRNPQTRKRRILPWPACTAARRLFTFSPHSFGRPAITM